MMRLVPGRVLIGAVGSLYLLTVAFLVLAPLNIVRYHTWFWELTGQHLGLAWTAGREEALDELVNVALFIPAGYLIHRWRRGVSSPTWSTVRAALGVTAMAAIASETIQIFLPSRHASVADVITDIRLLRRICGDFPASVRYQGCS
jgi:hypothetical protein